jgi:hypothetical protein
MKSLRVSMSNRAPGLDLEKSTIPCREECGMILFFTNTDEVGRQFYPAPGEIWARSEPITRNPYRPLIPKRQLGGCAAKREWSVSYSKQTNPENGETKTRLIA